jgi:hypothetical protein
MLIIMLSMIFLAGCLMASKRIAGTPTRVYITFSIRRVVSSWRLSGAIAVILGVSPSAHALTLADAERPLLTGNRDIASAETAAEGDSSNVTSAAQRPYPTLSWPSINISPTKGIGSGGLADNRVVNDFAQSVISRSK